ncbi:MAG: SPOR domain-containing protein [Casimicrobiaceae bacterium]
MTGVVLAGVLAIWVYQSLPYRPEVFPSARSDTRAKAQTTKPAETGQQVLAKAEDKTDAQRIVPPPPVVAPSGTNPAGKPAKTAESVPPAAASPEPSPTAEPRGRFWLQVGSYAKRSDADAQRAKFAVMGYEAQIQVAELPDKGTLHRVRIGPFRDPDEAARVRSELARQGIEVSVARPSAN